MNTPQKSTEFSAHLSWAAMRRYLQESLSPEESQRVERHLKHCPRCSAAIVEYIETEEPEYSKQYMKKLKGQLASSQTVKKRFLSAFQMKALRTSTAVVVLLVFSFFALKTVINKQGTSHQLPSESLAVVKKTPKATTPPREKKARVKQPTTKTATAKRASNKKTTPKQAEVARKQPAKKKSVAKAEAKEASPKTRTSRPTAQPVATPVAEKSAPEQSIEAKAPIMQKEAASSATDTAENTSETPAQEEPTRAAPLPTLKKLDTKKNDPVVAPLNSTQPATIPVPGSKIGER